MKKITSFFTFGLVCLITSSTIVGVTIYKNMWFGRRDLLLKSTFLRAMKQIDSNFMDKYGNKIEDVLTKTINLYQPYYKDTIKKELDSIVQKMNLEKTAKFWEVIRPFFMFVWDHRENVGQKDMQKNDLLYDELCKFAEKTEALAFKLNRQWYQKTINKFLTFYNEEQQKDLYQIVKKINDYTEIKDLYDNVKPLFAIWSSALYYYIEEYSYKYNI